MTFAIDHAAATVTVVPNLEDLELMLEFDALWVDQRGIDSDPTSFLTALEIQNIATFLATGRRVVMHGENSIWTDWNNQILGIVGSFFAGNDQGLAVPIVANDLTHEVSQVSVIAAGTAFGGDALFDLNFATLWGHGTNVLTILELGSQSASDWGKFDNATFFVNVADWVGCKPVPVSATNHYGLGALVFLVTVGLVVLTWTRR